MDPNLIVLFKRVCVEKGIEKGLEGMGLANVNAVWNDPRLVDLSEKVRLKEHVEARAIVTFKDKEPFFTQRARAGISSEGRIDLKCRHFGRLPEGLRKLLSPDSDSCIAKGSEDLLLCDLVNSVRMVDQLKEPLCGFQKLWPHRFQKFCPP